MRLKAGGLIVSIQTTLVSAVTNMVRSKGPLVRGVRGGATLSIL